MAHREIAPCRGCRLCFDRGEANCPLQDDLPALKRSMLAADGIIVASPVYVEDVNGVMKNWIDRLAHLCHRPEFAGKAAYLLTTSGINSSNHALRTLGNALRSWGFHLVGQQKFRTGALMDRDEMSCRHGDTTGRVAADLFDALRYERANRPSFFSLMTFNIQQRYWRRPERDRDTLDYAFWSQRNWLDPRQSYYIPHRTGPLTVLLARLAGAGLARFFC